MKHWLAIAGALFWIVPGRLNVAGEPAMFITRYDFIGLLILFFSLYVFPVSLIKSRNATIAAGVFLALAAFKVILGLAWVPQGLYGQYFANPEWNGPHEISWPHKSIREKATRIDTKLDFCSASYSLFCNYFPLHFANSVKYNWYGDQIYKRLHFQFSAKWKGYLYVGEDDPKRFTLIAQDYADIIINGRNLGTSLSGSPVNFELKPGFHAITMRYSHKSREARKLLLGWITKKGDVAAVPASRFALSENGSNVRNKALRIGTFGLHLAWLAMLTGMAWTYRRKPIKEFWSRRRTIIFSIVVLSMFVIGLDRHMNGMDDPWAEILSGGDDWLTYESMARNILSGDLLDIGHTGKGPYYYMPLYRYLLAGMHLFVGESVTNIIYAQHFIMILTIIASYFGCSKLYGHRVGLLVSVQAILFGL